MALTASLVMSVAAAAAGEADFIYVDRMPDILGELERNLTLDDEESGHEVVQDLYTLDFDHAVIETYVFALTCVGGSSKAAPRAFIVAIKYLPKRPTSFAVATLHDIYKEVYVEDRSGRIRLYEDLTGPSMLPLSERFKPGCVPI